MLPPGGYRGGDLKLPSGAHVAGVRGATRLILTRGPSLLASEHAETVTLSGLTLEGGNRPLPHPRGPNATAGSRATPSPAPPTMRCSVSTAAAFRSPPTSFAAPATAAFASGK